MQREALVDTWQRCTAPHNVRVWRGSKRLWRLSVHPLQWVIGWSASRFPEPHLLGYTGISMVYVGPVSLGYWKKVG